MRVRERLGCGRPRSTSLALALRSLTVVLGLPHPLPLLLVSTLTMLPSVLDTRPRKSGEPRPIDVSRLILGPRVDPVVLRPAEILGGCRLLTEGAARGP